MSEQEPEGDAWGTPDDGWSGDDAQLDVEPEVEPDDEAGGNDTGSDDEIIDAEIVSTDVAVAPGTDWGFADDRSAGKEIEPWAVTDDPAAHGWGQAAPQKPAEPARSEHGQRPGGGSQGGMKGDGAGGGAGTGKRKPTRQQRKRGMKGNGSGGGGGDNVLVKVERHVHKTTNISAIDARGSGSGNKAGVVEAPRRTRRGSGSRSRRGSS